MKAIKRQQLFTATWLSLLATSLSFGIRAGILNRLGILSLIMHPCKNLPVSLKLLPVLVAWDNKEPGL